MQANICTNLQGEIDHGVRFATLCSRALLSHVVDVLRLHKDKRDSPHLHQHIWLRHRDSLHLHVPLLCFQKSQGNRF